MIKIDKEAFWDLKINSTSDWEDLKEGVYAFSTYGRDAEAEAVLFAKHLGKVVCSSFIDKLREELNKGH